MANLLKQIWFECLYLFSNINSKSVHFVAKFNHTPTVNSGIKNDAEYYFHHSHSNSY